MLTLSSFLYENFDYIIITIIIIFTLLIVFSFLEIDFNYFSDTSFNEEPDKVINVETMENIINKNKNNSQSFCSKYSNDHEELNEQCSTLDETGCNIPSCCVWVNSNKGTKCMAGNKHGPYLQGTLNDPLKVNTYYFKNKCFSSLKSC